MEFESSIARRLAPEEVRPHTYVAMLTIIGQHMPWYCAESRDLERGEPYQLAWMPDAAERQPLWVVDVCLPYVLVKTAKKRVLTLDVRRCRLVQVSDQFGKAYFREFRSRRKRRKRQKEKQDKTESAHEAGDE